MRPLFARDCRGGGRFWPCWGLCRRPMAGWGGLGGRPTRRRRIGVSVLGAGNRAVYCTRRSDDTEAIWSEAPVTAWPGLDPGPFYTFVTIDP